jgi:biotin synthase
MEVQVILFEVLLRKIDNEHDLSKADICELLKLDDKQQLSILYSKADKIRKKYVGDEVHLRGLIEFSNYCINNCYYCGLRRDNKSIERYRMNHDEILETCSLAKNMGFRTIVLQSGDDPYYTAEIMESLIRQIKQNFDVAVTLSIGERKKADYECMYKAGADRFLLKFETSNRDLYAKMHPGLDFDHRIKILKWLKEIGYQTGSGIMVGLPGQSIEDLAEDILKFRDLDLDMIGIGPFVCHGGTPFAGSKNGDVELTFKVIALTRIVTKNTHIPSTTAIATLWPNGGREQALSLGANVVMPNLTPIKYRSLYEIYPSKASADEVAEQTHDRIVKSIRSIGRPISKDYGHSLKKR